MFEVLTQTAVFTVKQGTAQTRRASVPEVREALGVFELHKAHAVEKCVQMRRARLPFKCWRSVGFPAGLSC